MGEDKKSRKMINYELIGYCSLCL